MAADRHYGEFHWFYSVSPEYFGYTLVHQISMQYICMKVLLMDRQTTDESICNVGPIRRSACYVYASRRPINLTHTTSRLSVTALISFSFDWLFINCISVHHKIKHKGC
jgi:hypothetical protein